MYQFPSGSKKCSGRKGTAATATVSAGRSRRCSHFFASSKRMNLSSTSSPAAVAASWRRSRTSTRCPSVQKRGRAACRARRRGRYTAARRTASHRSIARGRRSPPRSGAPSARPSGNARRSTAARASPSSTNAAHRREGSSRRARSATVPKKPLVAVAWPLGKLMSASRSTVGDEGVVDVHPRHVARGVGAGAAHGALDGGRDAGGGQHRHQRLFAQPLGKADVDEGDDRRDDHFLAEGGEDGKEKIEKRGSGCIPAPAKWLRPCRLLVSPRKRGGGPLSIPVKRGGGPLSIPAKRGRCSVPKNYSIKCAAEPAFFCHRPRFVL